MTILGLEQPAEYGRQKIFDPTMANMVLEAQRRYTDAMKEEYERGLKDLNDFSTKYGDFFSPFSKDMARYNQMMGNIKTVIDQAYASGMDLTKSPEGRLLITQLTHSINPAEFNSMRANAKQGFEYIKAAQQLAANGRWSEAQELFDIARTGGLGYDINGNQINSFEDFSTAGSNGYNMFNRTPIQAATLQELAYPSYKGRSARVLNEQDFLTDKRLKDMGFKWDPKYRWTGFIDSDLMKLSPGASAALAADPRAAYFRDLSRQKVEASGIRFNSPEEKERAVEAQWRRDIADSQSWALIDPLQSADEYQLDLAKTRNQDWLNARSADRSFNKAMELEKFKAEHGGRGYGGSSSSSSGGSGSGKESLSEAQYQLESGTTNIIGQTSWGRASGISTYQDFSPEKLNYLLPAAQAEIAWKHYDNSISGGNGSTVIGKPKNNGLFTWNAQTGKFESNIPTVQIGAGVDITTKLGGEYKPATTSAQLEALKKADKAFIDDLSTDYTPAKFAQWTNKSTITGDNSMVNITRDYDALSRIYSLDEVALDSYGTGRPMEDLNWAKDITNSTRKMLELRTKNSSGRELCIKSTGKQVTKLAKDGAVHQYQLCKVYERTPKGNKYEELNNGELVAYDMGVDTYANPNFGINNNTDVNLYFDEGKDADTRWTGDQNVLHWEHVAAPAINSTIAYPQLPTWNYETGGFE